MEILHIKGQIYGIRSHGFSPALWRCSKKTPGMHFSEQHRAWVGWPDAVRECANKLKREGIELEGARPKSDCLAEPVDSDWRTGEKVREYQKDGAIFLASIGKTGALLADDMGLGKTCQACHGIKIIGGDAIVVCPAFVRGVWEREIKKWLPRALVLGLSGTKAKELPDAPIYDVFSRPRALQGWDQRIYLVHYDIIYAWAAHLAHSGAKTIVFDEVHMLQGEKSRRSQACREVARAMTYRVGLSGTPMRNRPRDLWNPIDTLCPGRFGSPFQFFLAHAGAEQVTVETRDGPKAVWKMDGASRLKELNRRLRFFMLRRTKSDVKMELPPRVRQIVELDVEKNFKQLPPRSLKNKSWLRTALAIAADGKIPKVVEIVANHVESGSKVIVFTYRKVVAQLIAAMLKKIKIDATTITGEISLKRRNEIIDEQHDVLACTMDSTYQGVDLSYADVAVNAELDYDPSKLIQAEARVFRFGQKRNVLIQYAIALDTVDIVIRDKVLDKLAAFEKAIGAGDDELHEDFKSSQVTTVKQLRSLAERIGQRTRKK